MPFLILGPWGHLVPKLAERQGVKAPRVDLTGLDFWMSRQARFPLWKIFNSTRPSKEISPEEATKGSLLRMIQDALGQQALEKKAE